MLRKKISNNTFSYKDAHNYKAKICTLGNPVSHGSAIVGFLTPVRRHASASAAAALRDVVTAEAGGAGEVAAVDSQ